MITIIFTVVFITIMLVVGYWGMKKTKTLNDFFLGGRNVGPWVSAFAYGTSYFSAVIFIGYAGKFGWTMGLPVVWIAIGNTIAGGLLAWMILAKRTRRMTRNLDVMTMPEFFEERYKSSLLKPMAAIITFVFLLPYSASVYKGLGHLFEITFGIDYSIALFVMASVTAIYLIMGGYFAVTLNDMIQGVIMLFGTVAMVAILVGNVGGLSEAIAQIPIKHAEHVPNQPPWWLLASLVFMTSFGTWGLPQMIQKFYAIKDESMIPRAAIITTIFAGVIGISAYFTGSLTHLFYDQLPAAGQHANSFDLLIPDLLKNHLPEYLMAIIVLLLLSASMSTLSSLVLVSASSIAIDLYKGHINPHVSSKQSMFMMRFLSGLFILMSFLIARYEIALIATLMAISWGAVAGSFLAVYIYGLFWRGATKEAAFWGIITGLGTMLIGFFIKIPVPVAACIAMILPFIVIPIISAFTQSPPKELLDKAFGKEIV